MNIVGKALECMLGTDLESGMDEEILPEYVFSSIKFQINSQNKAEDDHKQEAFVYIVTCLR
jgi:hypothetical protein